MLFQRKQKEHLEKKIPNFLLCYFIDNIKTIIYLSTIIILILILRKDAKSENFNDLVKESKGEISDKTQDDPKSNSLKDTLKLINKINANIFSKNDSFYGGSGNDSFWGYAGNDKISGGDGNDYLVGGKGNDKLIGGKGKDIFKLSKGKGYDLIQDFKNKQDKIFIGSMKKLKLKNKGNDVYIYKGKDLLAIVKGAKGDLSKKGKYFV